MDFFWSNLMSALVAVVVYSFMDWMFFYRRIRLGINQRGQYLESIRTEEEKIKKADGEKSQEKK